MKIYNRQKTKQRRTNLRKNQTDAEALLWSKLRRHQIHGYKFYRQFGIGFYIADFYCPRLKLAIELDGGQHYLPEGKAQDTEREKNIAALGIRIKRFSNRDVLLNLEGVLEEIENSL